MWFDCSKAWSRQGVFNMPRFGLANSCCHQKMPIFRSRPWYHHASGGVLALGKGGFWKEAREDLVRLYVMNNWVVVSTIFYFHPDPLGKRIHFDDHIFQRGWFNHQPNKFITCDFEVCERHSGAPRPFLWIDGGHVQKPLRAEWGNPLGWDRHISWIGDWCMNLWMLCLSMEILSFRKVY